MKLSISKSKNSESLYIQKSIRKNGVVSTLTVKKLGTMASLLPDHHNSRDEVIAWAKALAASMTEQDNLNKDTVLIPLSQSKLINFDKRTLFNGGYLFLQSIFHSLMLDKMCLNIQDNFKFDYDLADILAKLIYTRIIFPSMLNGKFSPLVKRKLIQPKY